MILFIDAGTPVLQLYPFALSAHPCGCHSGSLRSMCVESSIRHPFQLDEVLYAYTIKRHNYGKYYFVVDVKSLQFVINLLDTSKNKLQGNVMLLDAWGCARDPMLLEFRINLEPKSGWTSGCNLI